MNLRNLFQQPLDDGSYLPKGYVDLRSPWQLTPAKRAQLQALKWAYFPLAAILAFQEWYHGTFWINGPHWYGSADNFRDLAQTVGIQWGLGIFLYFTVRFLLRAYASGRRSRSRRRLQSQPHTEELVSPPSLQPKR